MAGCKSSTKQGTDLSEINSITKRCSCCLLLLSMMSVNKLLAVEAVLLSGELTYLDIQLKKSCSSDLLLSVLPAGIGHWVVLGLAGFIGRVHHPLASTAALALTETNDHARHFSNLFDIYSQGLGLEPNKDLIRTCKDQYSIL